MQSPKSSNTKTKRLTTIALILLAIALLIAILMPALHSMRSVAYGKLCGSNMSSLARAMVTYAGVYDEVFPDSSKWCDILIDYRDAYESEFRCKVANVGIIEIGVSASWAAHLCAFYFYLFGEGVQLGFCFHLFACLIRCCS